MIQKILATLVTYSISLQLILGGIPIAMLTSTNAHANKCAEGLEWNAILNRCLTSRQAAQVQSASARCQKITDKAAQNKCYVSALEQQVVDGEKKGEIQGAGKLDTSKLSILLAMATLISSVTTIKYLKTGCKAATSAWLMAGASASVFAGEVMSGMKFQKKSKEAFDDFQKVLKGQNETEGSEVQSEALNAMIKREDAVIEAAGTKKTFYTVAMAAYAAAGIMSIIEMTKYKVALANPTTAASATELFVCYKAKGATAEQKTLTQVKTFGGFSASMTFKAGLSAGAGGLGAIVGGGALVGSMLVGNMASGGVQDLNPKNGDKVINPNPSSGGTSTGGAGGGSSDPAPSNCGDQPCQVNNSHAPTINEYLESFFEKEQKVSYQTYFDTSSIDASTNWAEFYQTASEVSRFRAGEKSSETEADFELTKLAASSYEISESKEDFTFMKLAVKFTQQFGVQNAEASDILKGFAMILGMGGIGYAGATMLVSKSASLTSMFVMPATRATLSGIMTAVAMNQRSHMDDQKKKAEARKAFIEKLQLQVEAAGNGFGTCTQEQRNSDMTKPHCFCYLQGGSINTARVKSATCKAFFGSGLAKNMARPTSATSAREAPSCTTPNATVIDESCSCRRTNSCTSVPRAGFTSTGVGPSAIANMNDVLDGLNNGSLRAEDIKPEQMIARAAGLGRKQQALLNDPKNKALLNDIKKSDSQGQAAMRALASQIAGSPGLMGSNIGNMGSGAVGSGSPQEEIKKLQEDFKKDMSQYEPGEVAGGNGAALGAAGDDFSLDAVTGGGVTVEGDEKLAEVMDTNFEANGSDINSNSDANIFQVL
ncbi:MAG: hypothetical protein LW878_00450, partial [Proteobacteria bacterium]|nr:hypothetical protein [Pseudomonadota bacterium]